MQELNRERRSGLEWVLLGERRGRRNRKRGSALVFSLMMVGIVTASGMAMLQIHIARGRRQGQATDNKRALYIAEAGIAEAYLAVAQGRSGNVGTEQQPAQFANGVYWVEAEDGEENQVALRSTGMCRTGRFALSVVVERSYSTVTSLGMFGGEGVIVGEGAVIDGYDSREGSPPALERLLSVVENLSGSARVGTNGEAVVEGGGLLALLNQTLVHGNITPGPGQAVTIEPGALVTGSTLPGRSVVALPALETPEIPVDADEVPMRSGIPAGQYRFRRMGLNEGNRLTVSGPATVVLDHLRLEAGAELVVDSTDGPVTLFVGESLDLDPGSLVTNATRDPLGFTLLVGADDPVDVDGDGVAEEPFDFSPTGEFTGFVYAPYADVTVPGDLHLQGGLVAGRLTLEPGSRLSYDNALRSSDLTFSGLPRLVAWRIVALPDADIVNLRQDPLQQLSDAGTTPTRSSDAAQEGYLKMEYYDSGGSLQSYSGQAKDVNWGLVRAVVRVMWDDDSFVGDEGQEWVAPARLRNAIGGDGDGDGDCD